MLSHAQMLHVRNIYLHFCDQNGENAGTYSIDGASSMLCHRDTPNALLFQS